MEKSENRLKFLDDLPYFVDNIKLTDELLDKIGKHEYFANYRKLLQELNDKNNDRKLFVLLELTRERATCAVIVKLLKEDGQKELSERLNKFNESSGPMELTKAAEIKVAKATHPILGLSNTYTLMKKPRGKCIIINNVEDQQSPDVYDRRGNYIFSPKGLKRETIRFENIFTQLYFDVKVINNLSAKQMEEQLKHISEEKSLENDEAFVLIVISHGQDKKVLGHNACEAMRKVRFNEINKAKDLDEASQEMENDSIRIKDVVTIFCEENCPQLKSKPKLFFFICCRNKDVNKSDPAQDKSNYQENQMKPDEFKDPVIKDGKPRPVRNLDTFISYSCAQGFESNYDSDCGMSYFGMAFTQSIAQYACDENLGVIMNRTSDRLKKMFEQMKGQKQKSFGKEETNDSCLTVGCFAIQVNTYAMDRCLFFNPGFCDN